MDLKPVSRRPTFFCTCLYEIENKLPRTKRCRKACRAQEMIIEQRVADELSDINFNLEDYDDGRGIDTEGL